MAIAIIPLGISGGVPRVVTDLDSDGTAENDVNGAAATVYSITVDNTAVGAVSYFKAYDAAAPTVGTTAPDMILMVVASVPRTFIFTTGLAFSTALSYATVTAGGTAGTTNPTADVIVTIVIG